jgi:hypothetical protein
MLLAYDGSEEAVVACRRLTMAGRRCQRHELPLLWLVGMIRAISMIKRLGGRNQINQSMKEEWV